MQTFLLILALIFLWKLVVSFVPFKVSKWRILRKGGRFAIQVKTRWLWLNVSPDIEYGFFGSPDFYFLRERSAEFYFEKWYKRFYQTTVGENSPETEIVREENL